jgi:hypothetical protein
MKKAAQEELLKPLKHCKDEMPPTSSLKPPSLFPLQMASAELSSNQVQINKGILNGSNPLGVEVLGERAIIWVTTYCLKS